MTPAFVGRFDAAAPDGIASLPGKPIVQALAMTLQVADQSRHLLSGLGIDRLHPLQAPDDPMDFAPEEAGQSGFVPIMVPLGMCPIRQDGDLMQRLTAVVIVQHLHGRWEQPLRPLPDPRGAMGNDTQRDLVFGYQASAFTCRSAAATSSSVCTWCQLSPGAIRASSMR